MIKWLINIIRASLSFFILMVKIFDILFYPGSLSHPSMQVHSSENLLITHWSKAWFEWITYNTPLHLTKVRLIDLSTYQLIHMHTEDLTSCRLILAWSPSLITEQCLRGSLVLHSWSTSKYCLFRLVRRRQWFSRWWSFHSIYLRFFEHIIWRSLLSIHYLVGCRALSHYIMKKETHNEGWRQ